MSTRESLAYHLMKRHLCLPGDRFERVENGLSAGWPDVNYCLSGCEGWIELKSPLLPARITSTPLLASQHRLSADQSSWFLAQHLAKGRACLLITTEAGWALLPGKLVAKLGVQVNQLSWEGVWRKAHWRTPTPVQHSAWRDLREMLTV